MSECLCWPTQSCYKVSKQWKYLRVWIKQSLNWPTVYKIVQISSMVTLKVSLQLKKKIIIIQKSPKSLFLHTQDNNPQKYQKYNFLGITLTGPFLHEEYFSYYTCNISWTEVIEGAKSVNLMPRKSEPSLERERTSGGFALMSGTQHTHYLHLMN